MLKHVGLLLAALIITAPAYAAPACRDAKGKFIKCVKAAPAASSGRCRDAKGHFAKCGTPGAKPV